MVELLISVHISSSLFHGLAPLVTNTSHHSLMSSIHSLFYLPLLFCPSMIHITTFYTNRLCPNMFCFLSVINAPHSFFMYNCLNLYMLCLYKVWSSAKVLRQKKTTSRTFLFTCATAGPAPCTLARVVFRFPDVYIDSFLVNSLGLVTSSAPNITINASSTALFLMTYPKYLIFLWATLPRRSLQNRSPRR